MLTEQQKRQYEEFGYLIIENALNAQELEELRQASLALQEERERIGGKESLAVIHDVVYKGEAFMKTAFHPCMLAAVADLIGPNLQLQHSKLNWKPPTKGTGKVDWHQDFPYFPHTNFDLLAVMFYLDDTTPANGGMRLVPGSHKKGQTSIEHSYLMQGPDIDTTDYSPHPPVDLNVKAGGISMHHCLALHASHPNTTDTPRRGLVYQIRASDSIQIGGNFYRCYGVQLSGEDPMQARCVATTVRLPRHITNRGGIPTETPP